MNHIVTAYQNLPPTDLGLQAFLSSLGTLNLNPSENDLVMLGDGTMEHLPHSEVSVTWVPLKKVQGSVVIDRFHTAQYLPFADDDMVVLTDCRDVVFQGNPFHFHPKLVHVFQEDIRQTVDVEASNSGWIKLIHFGNVPADLVGKPIICAGVIAGRWKLLQHYLALLSMKMINYPPFFGLDQALHNLMVYTDNWLFERWSNEKGPVLHMVLSGCPPNQCSEFGVVENSGGFMPAIVHQYDRYPQVRDAIFKRYGVKT